ncbi:neurogenic locus notch homolog protein 3-like [Liolophura sinensis]|uniref:neurogenic locus notch homolog protein 3-like n=1 Tax=Liolophura sinensis TaxID=3198878 RepID=UPI003158B3C7
MCEHGGTLNIDECECICPRYFSGDRCQTDSRSTVSAGEKKVTTTRAAQTTTQTTTQATTETTVQATPQTAAQATTQTTAKATTDIMTTITEREVTICPYAGEKHDSDTCLGFGTWGQDRGDCLSRGGPWGCEQCAADPEFARGFCPVMCGICDPQCDGLMCEHGGTLNIDECECICPRYFSGDRCQTDTRATISSGIPEVTTITTAQTTTQARATTIAREVTICPYSGEKLDTDTCLGFGTWGQDRGDCLSRGGPWGCEQCAADPEFARGFCPVMCGICDPQCDGLMCEHGGTLNIDECECICPRYFSGDRCQTANCPSRDPWYCGVHPPPEYCDVHPFSLTTRQQCPHMCGIC